MRLFVTVGNRLEPFDRLLRAVDEAMATLDEEWEGLCQVGTGSWRPRYLECVPVVSQDAFAAEMSRADAVVCHAGVGTIRSALRAGHVPIVMARRRANGECVNDHQLEIVEALGSSITAVERLEEVVKALEDRRARPERPRLDATSDAAGRVAARANLRVKALGTGRRPWGLMMLASVMDAAEEGSGVWRLRCRFVEAFRGSHVDDAR